MSEGPEGRETGSVIITHIKNKLTDLWRIGLLQKDFINTFCEMKVCGVTDLEVEIESIREMLAGAADTGHSS